MGVLNLSEESPYSPSVFRDPVKAADYVDRTLIDEGADIVDVGLESANKRFEVRSADWELDRLNRAFEAIDRVDGEAVFSIETRYHEVAETALEGPFDMVNDICGFADPEMPAVCRAFEAAVVKMASPPDLHRPGAVDTVDEIFDALARGELTEKTIIDPAFGGWSETKTLEDDRATFRRLREFRALDRPMLVSINRKNFLRKLVDRSTEEALPVSLAATSMAVERGANVIRTHDVAETRDAALIGHAFSRNRPTSERVVPFDFTSVAEAHRVLDRLGLDRSLANESVGHSILLTQLSEDERAVVDEAAQASGLELDTCQAGVYIAGRPDAFTRFAGSLDESFTDIRDSL
jgi:dihydropteroate synthase